MPDIVVASGWRDRLEQLAGSRRQAWVVAGLLGAVVLGALALSSRSSPATVAPPARSTAGPSPAAPAPSSQAGATIYVHVAGLVQEPGLYELAQGARVADAIEAAGGPRGKADVNALNLAEPLVDGAKVEVPRRGRPGGSAVAAVASGSSSQSSSSNPIVNINAADQAALESIPGIGPAKAAAILQYRSEIGRFTSIDQLLDVRGIGPATLESIRPYIAI